MNESFKTDPSLATSARAAKESGSYLCASNVTPTAVRFIVSVFLCLLCFCRMSSTQMTCSHFRKNRPKKRQKPPILGRSTGASLIFSHLCCNGFEMHEMTVLICTHVYLVFGDEFLAQGLHLKSHQMCSAAFCRSVKFFHTDWIIISLWSLPYTQRHCHVRIEKGSVQTVAIKLEAHDSLEYHYMLKH